MVVASVAAVAERGLGWKQSMVICWRIIAREMALLGHPWQALGGATALYKLIYLSLIKFNLLNKTIYLLDL